VCGQGHDAYDRSIDVQVSRLRRKIEPDSKRPDLIRTVRNGGYMFCAKVTRS
jgi:two-component system OmpR family response regulator